MRTIALLLFIGCLIAAAFWIVRFFHDGTPLELIGLTVCSGLAVVNLLIFKRLGV